jgi:hypothetical protein
VIAETVTLHWIAAQSASTGASSEYLKLAKLQADLFLISSAVWLEKAVVYKGHLPCALTFPIMKAISYHIGQHGFATSFVHL